MYYNIDTTGSESTHRVDNYSVKAFKMDQRVELHPGVYADTIQITIVGPAETPLVYGVDWTYSEVDMDYTAMSRACIEAGDDFSRELIKSIVITKPISSPITLNFSYQMLYPDGVKAAIGDIQNDNVFELTPELFVEMLQKLQYVSSRLGEISNGHSVTMDEALVLEEDRHMELTENVISGELHEINVPDNRCFIRPAYGDFYNGTETVYVDSPLGRELIKGEEYDTVSPNNNKTLRSSVTNEVRGHIIIKKPIVGQVRIGYHAYGGDVSIPDVETLQRNLTNIVDHIHRAQFLTPEALPGMPVIQNLSEKLHSVEEKVRSLSEGAPLYNDATYGRCLVKKIKSTDNFMHWWTVAELYKVDGSQTVHTADMFKGRFEMANTGFMFTATATVNLDNPNDPLTVDVQSCNYPKGYLPFEDYSGVDYIIRPQFRVVWNNNPTYSSGALLQIGFPLRGWSEETLCVEDMSGQESCWIMVDDPAASVPPEDDNLELPCGDQVWSISNNLSQEYGKLIPLRDGYLIWAGTQCLNEIDGWGTYDLEHMFHDKLQNIDSIKRVRLDLKERDGSKFPVEFSFIEDNNILKGYRTINYRNDLAHLIMTVSRDTDGHLKFVLEANVLAGTAAVPLDLYHVTVFG